MAQRNRFGFVILVALIGILTFILFRPFAFAIAIAAGAVIAVTLLFYLSKWLLRVFRKFRLRNSLEGILESKLEGMGKRIQKNQKELNIIDQELTDLENQLAYNEGLSQSAIAKVENLIREFSVEKDLKETKLKAFKMIESKFVSLLNDQKILKKMARKKAKLKEVSARKEEEILELNSLVSEKEFIEDVDFIRLKIEETEDIETALSLNNDLSLLER